MCGEHSTGLVAVNASTHIALDYERADEDEAY